MPPFVLYNNFMFKSLSSLYTYKKKYVFIRITSKKQITKWVKTLLSKDYASLYRNSGCISMSRNNIDIVL